MEEARKQFSFSSSFITPKHASLTHYATTTLGVQLPAAMAQTAFLAPWASRSSIHLQATLSIKSGNFQETNDILCKEKNVWEGMCSLCESACWGQQGGEVKSENVLIEY